MPTPTLPVATRARRRLVPTRLAAAAIVAGVTGLAACGGDDDEVTITVGSVVVEGTGVGESYDLPAAFAVGQTASTSATLRSTVGFSGADDDDEQSVVVEVAFRSEVVEVLDDGGAVVESAFESAAVTEQPSGGEFDDDAIEDLTGVRYRETYAADGSVTETELVDEDELSGAQRQAAEDLIGQASSNSISFPDEPVGVGATWTSDSTLVSQGVEIVVTDRYELLSVDDGVYTISVDYGTPIDDEVSGTRVTGSIEATGTIRGDVANPLALSTTITQVVEMTAEDQGTLRMTVDVVTEADGIGATAAD